MINRRKFIKLGAAVATVPLLVRTAHAKATEILKKGGEAYSHFSGTKLSPVPSICGQCPSQCAIIGYMDEGRVVKIEGQPNSIRNQGKVCAKGQSGVQKIYDPDRILSPLRRTGKRGQGEWEKISWDVALKDLTARLKKLRDDGNPEKFVFHHGWITSSAEKAPEYNRLSLQSRLDNSAGRRPYTSLRATARVAPTGSRPAFSFPVKAEDKVVAAAVELAEQLKAKALVVFTQTGNTARRVSRQRPQVPVIVLARAADVQRKLQLNWGIQAFLIKSHPALEAVVEKAQKILLKQKCVQRGDTIVILASSPKGTKTNFIKVHGIG